ncbi:hypothetical protein CEP52_017654 [Fusarium oligoseptatum]|uniref:Uncharacterized protein n=1 Tax=Fusarium oligoseptatum TaxID=2604345 RepID=A0A428RKY9_9HYPO|nr:hypothetical protein CEP52_017654 [Fusarium oligoseptatum]
MYPPVGAHHPEIVKLQATACCLWNHQAEHGYKRPTFVTPLDKKQDALFSPQSTLIFCSMFAFMYRC